MAQYTYLIGLVVYGLLLGTAGLIAAGRERRALNKKENTRPSS